MKFVYVIQVSVIAVFITDCLAISDDDDDSTPPPLPTVARQDSPGPTDIPGQVRYIAEDELEADDDMLTIGNEADIGEDNVLDSERSQMLPGEIEDDSAIEEDERKIKGFNRQDSKSRKKGNKSATQKLLGMMESIKKNIGCPEGLFHFAPTAQCFLLLNDTGRDWSTADKACKAKGLVLAQPYEPAALRNYIVTRFGDLGTYIWVGAKGTGSYVRYQRSRSYVGSYNPNWYYRTGSTSYCLTIVADDYYMKSYGIRVYYSRPCSYKYYTLCEQL